MERLPEELLLLELLTELLLLLLELLLLELLTELLLLGVEVDVLVEDCRVLVLPLEEDLPLLTELLLRWLEEEEEDVEVEGLVVWDCDGLEELLLLLLLGRLPLILLLLDGGRLLLLLLLDGGLLLLLLDGGRVACGRLYDGRYDGLPGEGRTITIGRP